MTEPEPFDLGVLKFREFIENPASILALSEERYRETIDMCRNAIHRVRPGNRSGALPILSIFLWYGRDRLKRDSINVEELLADAFRIAIDPSFIEPEWALVLIGVLLARYEQDIPQGRSRDETLRQLRHNLRYLQSSPATSDAVQLAAGALLSCWDSWHEGTSKDLQPIIRACHEGWPSTAGGSAVRDTIFDNQIGDLIANWGLYMGALTKYDRQLCRLYFERNGEWNLLENISLK
ncbi:MAG: hypothetical protein HZA51_18260 [Planctomycetes bacterium]|nr:hypothetical protein [Planctomycetota bacterium]